MKKLLLISLFWVAAPVYAQATDTMGIPILRGGNSSLWYRYCESGEDAFRKKDMDKAKQYWLAGLGELEKYGELPKGDMFIKVRISMLEERLTEMYPKDLDKNDSGDAKIVELQKEQAGILTRIANFNRRTIKPTDRLVPASVERADTACKALQKSLAKQKQIEAGRKAAAQGQ